MSFIETDVKNHSQHEEQTLMVSLGNEGPDQTAHAQSDQGLRCPFTDSPNTVQYITAQ